MLDIRPDSTSNKFRAARIARLKSIVDKSHQEKSHCRILDIGGTYNFWHIWRDQFDWSKTEVVCVNLDPSHYATGKDQTRITMIQGNACDLHDIKDQEYDVAFSNSVIEHVGRWSDMVNMAKETRRVAKRYLLQTPYFWFPIEPHARTPLLHWIPESWAYRIVMARKCGFWSKAETIDQAMRTVQSAKMLDGRQLAVLFPDGKIEREKFLGVTKALMAIRE
jgi:2-polyprenyl-3-methyl-5-hydroxy-6-metoxy-1,4-benzoquinol methylase